MKKKVLVLLLSIACYTSFAQSYISLAPCLTNSAGTLLEKGNAAIEFGRQWDVFSMGIDVGKTSFGKIKGRDTTAYVELRPNLNVFQQGKFTNTFTAGIGYVFNSILNLMTELTSGIEYAFNDKVHFNVFFGQYFYSGKTDASDVTFFGASVMLYFLPSHHHSLLKQPAKPTQ